jgi:cell division septation protein DedD
MAKNEDGEFEVLVGNKQLLSILFVLMVMFGIVFTMGYFVGRNSTLENTATSSRPSPSEGAIEARPNPAPDVPPSTAAAPAQQPPAASGDTAALAGAETVPVGGAPREAAAEPPATPPPVPAASGPQPGQTYIQVTAAARSAAEIFVEALKKKGLPAMVGDSVTRNGEELFRVLVGPYNDPATLARARTDLEALLKQKVFVRKY